MLTLSLLEVEERPVALWSTGDVNVFSAGAWRPAGAVLAVKAGLDGSPLAIETFGKEFPGVPSPTSPAKAEPASAPE